MSVSIRDAMTDPALFGPIFGGESFTAWRALLSGFYGLELDATELDTFKSLTGRQSGPEGAFLEYGLPLAGAAARAMQRRFWPCIWPRFTITAPSWHRAKLRQ